MNCVGVAQQRTVNEVSSSTRGTARVYHHTDQNRFGTESATKTSAGPAMRSSFVGIKEKYCTDGQTWRRRSTSSATVGRRHARPMSFEYSVERDLPHHSLGDLTSCHGGLASCIILPRLSEPKPGRLSHFRSGQLRSTSTTGDRVAEGFPDGRYCTPLPWLPRHRLVAPPTPRDACAPRCTRRPRVNWRSTFVPGNPNLFTETGSQQHDNRESIWRVFEMGHGMR